MAMDAGEAELRELWSRHEFDAALTLIHQVRNSSEPANPLILLDEEIEILSDKGDFASAEDLLKRSAESQRLVITLKYIEFLILTEQRGAALDVLRALVKSGGVPVAHASVLMSFLLDLEKLETFDRMSANEEIVAHPGFSRRLTYVGAHRQILGELAGADLRDPEVFRELCRRLGDIDGFRHNFRLPDGSTLMETVAVKTNSPVEALDFNFVEWDEIKTFVGSMDGKRVLDVGGADGFFSIEAAKDGAEVTYLDPDHLFLQRAKLFAHHFGVEDKIEFKRGLLQRSFLHLNGRYDLVLALGLIYHLDNLALGLRTLMELSDTLVIETATGDVSWTEDRQAVLFQDHDPLDFDWVVGFFKRHGYGYVESTEWAEYVNRYPKSAGRRLACFSRR